MTPTVLTGHALQLALWHNDWQVRMVSVWMVSKLFCRRHGGQTGLPCQTPVERGHILFVTGWLEAVEKEVGKPEAGKVIEKAVVAAFFFRAAASPLVNVAARVDWPFCLAERILPWYFVHPTEDCRCLDSNQPHRTA